MKKKVFVGYYNPNSITRTHWSGLYGNAKFLCVRSVWNKPNKVTGATKRIRITIEEV